ncbi:hypothetical protein [Acinetobacter sp.]|uniref:hypothetical protein n=1 Tax=Acinetobacter sp. TaxID=472 RepID=UPI002FC728E8
MNRDFNWDNWASKSPFNAVWDKTSYLQNVRAIPTCYSPDGKYLYLSSLDYEVEIESVSQLEKALDDILDSYVSRLSCGDSAKTKLNLAIRQCDFEVICTLLNGLQERYVDQVFNKNHNYSLPEDLFKKLLEDK